MPPGIFQRPWDHMRHLLPVCCPSVLKANSLRSGTLSFFTVIVSFSACLPSCLAHYHGCFKIVWSVCKWTDGSDLPSHQVLNKRLSNSSHINESRSSVPQWLTRPCLMVCSCHLGCSFLNAWLKSSLKGHKGTEQRVRLQNPAWESSFSHA